MKAGWRAYTAYRRRREAVLVWLLNRPNTTSGGVMSGIASIARHVFSQLPDLRNGACRDEDPELFHPIGNSGPARLQIAEAKSVCGWCPALAACREYALSDHNLSGVWGGLDDDERRAVRTKQSKKRHAEKKKAEKEVAV